MIGKISKIIANVHSKGFFHLFSANLIISFFSFGSQLIVSKILNPVEVGQIKTMQSFVGLASILAGFGFNTAILKLCSENRPEEEKAQIFRDNTLYSLVPTLIVLVICFGISLLGLFSPVQAINSWMKVYMFLIPAQVLTSTFLAYFQAMKKIRLMAKLQVIIRVLGIFVLIGITYAFNFQGYIYATIFVTYLALFPLFKFSRQELLSDHPRTEPSNFAASFSYAKWATGANLLSAVGTFLDIFLLNYLVSDREAIGYYSIASILLFGLNQITATIQSIATPYFSEKSENRDSFIAVLKKYQKLIVIVALIITIAAIIAVPVFINLFFGQKYEMSGTLFRILALRYFFWSCYVFLGAAMIGLGKIKVNFYCTLVSLMISTIPSYILIQSWGLIGAAVSQALSALILLVILSIVIPRVIRNYYGDNDLATVSE